MNKIYKYNNFKSLFLIIMFVSFLLIGIELNIAVKEYFLLFYLPILIVASLSLRWCLSGTGKYKSITVDNINQQLVFRTKDYDEIFLYKDIQKITYLTEPQLQRRRCVTTIYILFKTGYEKEISFTNYEFDSRFLNKLPESIYSGKRNDYWYKFFFKLLPWLIVMGILYALLNIRTPQW